MVIPFKPKKKRIKKIKRKPIITGSPPVGNVKYTVLYTELGEEYPVLEALDYDTLWQLFLHYVIGIPQWAYHDEMYVLQWISTHTTQHPNTMIWVLPYVVDEIAYHCQTDVQTIEEMIMVLVDHKWVKPIVNGFQVSETLMYPFLIQNQTGWHRVISKVMGLAIGYQVF